MMRWLLITGLTFAPLSAQALSCLAPDFARQYAQADGSEARYNLALGRLDIDDGFQPPPPPADINNPTPYTANAVFYGQLGNKAGFTTDFSGRVTLDVVCLAAWCGGLPAEHTDLLMFLELTHDGHRLTLGPCGGEVFAATPENIMTGRRCLSGNCPAITE